jgi:hypothetical protein
MAKKTPNRKPTDKTSGGKDKGPRWTVRGVDPQLQRAAGDMARADGATLGVWLSGLIADASAGRLPSETTAAWFAEIERRLARLETTLPKGLSAVPSRAGAGARPGGGRPARPAS